MLGLKVGAWYAGCDYVRLTAKPGGLYGRLDDVYRKVARAIVAESHEGEMPFERWAWRGYYGETCSGVSYGRGWQGDILQVSGSNAQDEALLSVPYDNVARCDAQITIWCTADTPNVARCAAQASRLYVSEANGGKWITPFIDGDGKGDTTYIGSRSSDSFIRIYDKWRQSGEDGEYTFAWRFEVETKNEDAKAIWPEKGAAGSNPDYWAAIVRSRLRQRGIVLPRLDGARVSPPPRPRRDPTTNDRRLAWLRNQVGPVVDKMLADGVKFNHIAQALGLTGTTWGD